MYKNIVHICMALLLMSPGIAAAAGVIQLPATNQDSCFNAAGNPRACTGTGEDGEKKAGVAWPAPRFVDKGDGTVKDKLTELLWSKRAKSPDINSAAPFVCANADSDMTWLQSLDFIACLNSNNYLGFKDWRLPNLNELESMVNSGVADTSVYLNANGFDQVRSGQYWTSTTDASNPVDPVSLISLSAISAWDMDLAKGDFPFSALKNNPPDDVKAVWPVRGGSVQIWRTGQTVCFDEVGNTRPCAGSGEDGEKLAGAAWPVPRFKVNTGSPFVLDKLTGLIWPSATMSPGPALCADTALNLDWQQSLDHVACLNTNNYLGRSDWRMPNRKELRSLVDYSTGAPALPGGHPFDDLNGLTYWSSTTDTAVPKNAWVISMLNGSLSSAVKAGTLPVWPVSGPDLTPSVTSATPTPGTYSGSVTVELSTTKPGSTIYYAINEPVSTASAVYTAPIVLTSAATAPYNVRFLSVDFSGNIEEIKNVDYTLHVGDLTGSVTINNGAQVTKSTGVTLALTASDPLGVPQMQVACDGVTFGAVEAFAATRSCILPDGDGVKTVAVKFIDGGGIVYPPIEAQIVLDTVPPAASITPAPGIYSNAVSVVLTSEAGSTIHVTTDGTAVTTASPVYTVPLLLTAGAATTAFNVRYLAVDKAGNAGAANLAVFTVHAGDLSGSIRINNDALYTNSNVVNLALSATDPGGVDSMQFSNDGVNFSSPELYATSKTWTLSPGDGLKTVYVKFTDGYGIVYAPFTAQITLDTAKPASSATPGAGTYVESISIELAVNEAGVTYYTTDGSTPTVSSSIYTGPVTFTAPSSKTLRFFSIDKAGNSESVQSLNYTLHSHDLTGSVVINDGALFTNSHQVNLTLSASDPADVVEMQVACDGTNYALAEPYAGSRGCSLSTGDGLKTVLVKFRDGLGNWYPPVNAQISLDTNAPVTDASPASGTYSAKVTVVLAANEDGTIHYTTNGDVPTTSSPVYNGPFDLTVPSTTTTFNVQYFAVDRGGNKEQVKSAVYTLHVSDLTGSVAINNGTPYAVSPAVNLTLSAQDPAGVNRMQFSNDGINYTPLEPYATGKAWTLAGSDGLKTVFVRFEDGDGMLYTLSASVTLSSSAASVSSCDLNGDNKVDISDALKALQMSIGLLSPTMDEKVRGDVAPLVNGIPKPDGVIDIADTLVILRRSLGLVAPW